MLHNFNTVAKTILYSTKVAQLYRQVSDFITGR